MIRATFFAVGKKVTTDSLYQWDTNQTLEITGSKLTTAPTIHFGNKASDIALVVQSELVDGVVRAPIPNTMVAEPYPVYAFLVTLDGEVANTRQVFEIPIIPRPRPHYYEYADNQGVVNYELLSDRIVRFEDNVNARVNGLETNINTFQNNVTKEVDRLALIVEAMGSMGMDKVMSMFNRTTAFPADGSIVETGDGWTKTTAFNDDGSIDETLRTTNEDGSIHIAVKRTTFLADGSVVETITQSYIE